MTIPDYETLMLPVLEIARRGETSVPAVEAEIAARFGLTEEEREQMLRGGKQRVLQNRLLWATINLTGAGLLKSPRRGRFVISEAGSKVLDAPPPKLNNKFLFTLPAFHEFKRGTENGAAAGQKPESPPSTATPE